MKKAILSKKDQVLHKLVLFEVREKSYLLDKYIAFDQLQNMYNNMISVVGNHIYIKNITDMVEYKRLSFFYESIIHEYSKKYRISEDQVKVLVIECSTLHELKDAIGYLEYRDLYKDEIDKESQKEINNQVVYEDIPAEEVGYRSSL